MIGFIVVSVICFIILTIAIHVLSRRISSVEIEIDRLVNAIDNLGANPYGENWT